MLEGIPSNAMDLLDCLVELGASEWWVRNRMAVRLGLDRRTLRRCVHRLSAYGLIESRREGRVVWIRATALGVALIDAQHQGHGVALCAK